VYFVFALPRVSDRFTASFRTVPYCVISYANPRADEIVAMVGLPVWKSRHSSAAARVKELKQS